MTYIKTKTDITVCFRSSLLGGRDSNPDKQDQNLLSYR